MNNKPFTKEEAIQFLMEHDDWNFYGAEAIVDTLIADGMLQNITEKELLKISEDYKDR